MLADYASQQMMSGAGVFRRSNDKWIGTHMLGGAFWPNDQVPTTEDNFSQPQVIVSHLINAGAMIRYAVFVPATHFLRKLLR
jgi:hypothetical protein